MEMITMLDMMQMNFARNGGDMEKIVRVWIGNDYVEFEAEDNCDSEDEFYEAIVNDVYNSISIEIL